MRVSTIVGNPKPESRTLDLANTVAAQVCAVFDAEQQATIDLANHADRIFKWPNEELDDLAASVAKSDVLVVASPTYKATYTGLLKAFFDRYPNQGLAGVVAIPVMTAATPLHGMAADSGLRPLMVELGASVPTRSFFFLISDMGELGRIVHEWVEENVAPFSTTFNGH